MLYVFQLKLFKQWNFGKLEVTFLAELSRKNYRFSMEAIQVEVFLYFCLNSFHSFKARLEKT